MNDKTIGGVHWNFWLIDAVALIWNLMGVMNLFMQMNADKCQIQILILLVCGDKMSKSFRDFSYGLVSISSRTISIKVGSTSAFYVRAHTPKQIGKSVPSVVVRSLRK